MEPRKKSRLNFVIEGITLLDLMLMITTGLIMEFRLPPGTGGEGAALHGGLGRPALTLAGFSRHQWGTIHFYLATTMLVLLVLHVWLHWRWIWAIAQGGDPARRTARGRTFLAASALFLALAALPWLVPLRGGGPFDPARAVQPEVQQALSERAGGNFSIYGAMTLNEVAQAAGVTQAEVFACLGGSGPVSGEERMGPLARRFGLSMAEARTRIMKLSRQRQIQE